MLDLGSSNVGTMWAKALAVVCSSPTIFWLRWFRILFFSQPTQKKTIKMLNCNDRCREFYHVKLHEVSMIQSLFFLTDLLWPCPWRAHQDFNFVLQTQDLNGSKTLNQIIQWNPSIWRALKQGLFRGLFLSTPRPHPPKTTSILCICLCIGLRFIIHVNS